MRIKRLHNMKMVRRPKRSAISQFFYNSQYRIGEYGIRSFLVLLPWIPYRWLARFTLSTARLSYMFLWKYRKRMEENVEKALAGEITDPAERKALIWRAWSNFALGVLDSMAVMYLSQEQIAAKITIEGEEHLERARAKGQGVIALSAHLGAFTLIGARLAVNGYPFTAVVKHPGDERFARMITEFRARVGIQTISARPRQEAVRGILRALRQNGIVLVIADEFKSGGVETIFMGQKAAAPRGTASLALRTGAAVLPMFAPRRPDGSVILRIGPEIDLTNHDDLEASVAETTRLFTGCIEEAVRRFPDQWNWFGFPRPERISRAEYLRRNREAQKAAEANTPPGAPAGRS